MYKREAWIDHHFKFGIGNGWLSNILNRLEDTPLRLTEVCKNLSDEQLSKEFDEQWSIKEHIGHLSDLEMLWCNRLKQFEQGVPTLVEADMSNQMTHQSNHNLLSLDQLLSRFYSERKKLLVTLSGLNALSLEHTALHPRLEEPMQAVDLLFFVAEHDDHHLTSIKDIIQQM